MSLAVPLAPLTPALAATAKRLKLSAIEWKVIDHLVVQPSARAAIAAVQPNPKTTQQARDRICLRLFNWGLLDYAYRVTQFAISPSGRLLLNLQTTSLPLTPLELWTLQACRSRGISPDRLARVPEADRQRVIRHLAARQLITVKKQQILEVWLTSVGQQYAATQACNGLATANHGQASSVTVRSATELLAVLPELDPQGTGVIPIFQLRDWLQPPLTAAQLDGYLLQLQRQDQIELSKVQTVEPYSDRQIAAGLKLPSRSKRWPELPWFFVHRV